MPDDGLPWQRCTCGVAIVFGRRLRAGEGRPVRVEIDPSKGPLPLEAVRVYAEVGRGGPRGLVVAGETGIMWRNHFETCPDRAQHRRRGSTGGSP